MINVRLLVTVILVLVLVGALPLWPYSHAWGYWPGSVVGVVLLLLILSVLL